MRKKQVSVFFFLLSSSRLCEISSWTSFFFFLSSIAYYVAFGPHGPRAPTSAPGDGLKIFLATAGLIGLAGVLYLTVQSFGMSLDSQIVSTYFFADSRVRVSCSTTEDID